MIETNVDSEGREHIGVPKAINTEVETKTSCLNTIRDNNTRGDINTVVRSVLLNDNISSSVENKLHVSAVILYRTHYTYYFFINKLINYYLKLFIPKAYSNS